jgi:uncharacterized protein (TIGR03435 family)
VQRGVRIVVDALVCRRNDGEFAVIPRSGDNPAMLRLERRGLFSLAAVVGFCLVPRTAVLQTLTVTRPASADGRRFEVASVKPNTTDVPPSSRFPLGPGDAYVAGTAFVATNQPLANYIRFAFGLSQGDALRLPGWVSDERFDINARAAGQPTKDDMRRMMRALLVDRCKLAWHVEQRESAVFELVLAAPGRLGPQLTPHRGGIDCGQTAAGGGDPAFDAIPCASAGLVAASSPGRSRISGRAEPIARLAALLSNNGFAGVDRVVLDRTGLAGTFDFTVEWALPIASTDAVLRPLADDVGPSLGTAMREQLGLILRSAKAPIDVLVIDRVERPEPD